MTQKLSDKWREQAEALKEQAKALPHGKERERWLRRARQLQTASQVERWISSPGLEPPT